MNPHQLAIMITGIDATQNVFNKVSRNIKSLSADCQKLWSQGNKFGAFQKGLGALGNVTGMGAATLGAFAMPAIAKIASAQDGFKQVEILTDKTADEMKSFRSQIYQIATETGQSVENLLTVATNKIRGGMKEADVFGTLKQESLYATATGSKNLEAMAKTTKSITRQMKLNIDHTQDAWGGLLEISKKGAIALETFGAGSESLLGEAGALGMTGKKGLMQVYSAAQIAAKDADPETAMANVNAFLADVKKNKTEGAFKKLGIEINHEAAWKSGDYFKTVIDKVLEKTGGLGKGEQELILSQLFRSGASRNFIRSMSGDMKKYAEMWQSANEVTGNTKAQKDAGKALKTLSGAWGKFQTQLETVGNDKVAPWLERLTNGMAWLTGDTLVAKVTMNAFLGLLTVSATAKIGGAFMGVTNNVIGIGKSAVDAASKINKLRKTTGSLTDAMSIWARYKFPNAAGVLIPMKNSMISAKNATWDFIKALYAKSAAWLKTKAISAGSFLSKIGAGMKVATTATWGFVKALIAQAAAWTMTPMGMITIAIAAIAGGAILLWKNWSKVTKFFKDAWNWISGLWSKMPGWLHWCFPIIKITTVIIGNWSKVKAFFGGLWTFIRNAFQKVKGIITGFSSFFINAGANIITNIINGIKRKVTKLYDTVKDTLKTLRGYLPFSPAKEGPLKDIHQLKFSETIAQSIKEGPLLSKAKSVFGKVKTAFPMSFGFGGGSAMVPTLQNIAAGIAKAVTIMAATAAPRAIAQQASYSKPQITINIDAKGAAPGVQQNIEAAIMKAIPKIEKALEQSSIRNTRIKH